MGTTGRRLLVLGLLVLLGCALFAVGASAQGQAQAQSQDPWRYTFHNGEWWYWLPAGRWVYWRGGQWNDYSPQTSIPNAVWGFVPAYNPGRTSGYPWGPGFDIRPFYGHSLSTWGYPYSSEQSEIGPFYGHAVSTWGSSYLSGREISPFYGHAVSGTIPGPWRGGRFDIRPFYGHAY